MCKNYAQSSSPPWVLLSSYFPRTYAGQDFRNRDENRPVRNERATIVIQMLQDAAPHVSQGDTQPQNPLARRLEPTEEPRRL